MDTEKNLHDILEEKLGIEPAVLVIDLLNNISVKELYDLIERHELEYHYNGASVPKNHPYSLFTYHQETTSELTKKVKDLEEENAKLKAELEKVAHTVYQKEYVDICMSTLKAENAKLKADMQKIKDLHEGIRLITDLMIDMNMKGL